AVMWQAPYLNGGIIDGAYLQAAPPSTGAISRELWTGISGTTVASLTSNARYPALPNQRSIFTSFEGSSAVGDNYGSRIHGWVVPPENGSYVFWIAGDDNCELWLGTDETTASERLIAQVPGWTASREWTKYPQQQSLSLALTKGRRYAIMALHKEGGGGDQVAVAWEGPGLTRQVIAGQYLQPEPVPSGSMTHEVWTGITGTTVASLTSSTRYPAQPTTSDELATMETQANSADNYGARLHGYVIPPLTGVFTFWIAGDDNCELWLSTDETPANRQLIAKVPGSTAARQWTKFPEQMSLEVTLTAGRKYYIMALQKEGTGSDHVAVAWQGPGITQTVIGGPWLAPFVPGTSVMAFDDEIEPPRPIGNAVLPGERAVMPLRTSLQRAPDKHAVAVPPVAR
ncbi:MAG TPA: PA14 domain-containing protein, partial [Planctomycetota bacterium]|nr:PA14 domain-containing protein [Planctomycetota bacterium]